MKVKDLYKIDMLAFDSKIGYITNLGTTFYEMQSQYEVGSPEYEELNRRLKLCCIEQNRTIDAAKGLKTKPFPRHWTSFQKITEEDSDEEKSRKEFENKLIIDKRPEFMKFLYSRYNREFNDFKGDFDLFSMIKFGKKVDEIKKAEKKSDEEKEMLEYYDKKNPLLETNGVMNRLCRYMQSQLKDIGKKSRKADPEEMFDVLYDKQIEPDSRSLDLMVEKYHEYCDFKKSKQLSSSEFSTYEQYYKYLRNRCLENISSNIEELANLAIYVCYKMFPCRPKDFCWDVFGSGIVQILQKDKEFVRVPCLDENGEVEYLGARYGFSMIDLLGPETETLNEYSTLEDFSDEEFFEGFDEIFEDLEDV